MVEAGEFLEWAVYNDNQYGTSWASIQSPLGRGTDVLLEIEVQGAGQVRARREDARLIFLLPPSMKVLRERLTGRGTDTREAIERRLALAECELRSAPGLPLCPEATTTSRPASRACSRSSRRNARARQGRCASVSRPRRRWHGSPSASE